ncbi:MAG: putative transposase [Thermoanaerobacterales bacterium 50_218]|nr:MAG: putative transposase [Thermoanaerobacterales bacterium 50_218]
MIFGGIDVAKSRHEVCLVNDAGDVILQIHVDNNQKGMDRLLRALGRLNIKPDDVKFCLEATGHYWLPIYCHLMPYVISTPARQRPTKRMLCFLLTSYNYDVLL